MTSDEMIHRYIITFCGVGVLAFGVYYNAGYTGVETMLLTIMAVQFIQMMGPKQ